MEKQKAIPLPRKRVLHHRYSIIRMLAEGGFGVTYLANDEHGVTRVIKEHFPTWYARRAKDGTIIPLEGKERDYEWSMAAFLQEASQLSVLNHRNIVHLVDAFRENGTAYYVMPYLSGGDLTHVTRRLFEEGKCLSQAAVLSLLRGLLEALQHMHSRRLRASSTPIYHLDIKPANVLLATTPDTLEAVPQLIDFGSPDMGTPGYVPHEQREDGGYNIGPWTDLFSLAATIHKLLMGSAPPSHLDIKNNPLTTPPARQLLSRNEYLLSRYDIVLLESLDKALEWDYSQRFSSATEWLDALSGIPLRIPDEGSSLDEFVKVEKEETSPLALIGISGATALVAAGVLLYTFGPFKTDIYEPEPPRREPVEEPPAPKPQEPTPEEEHTHLEPTEENRKALEEAAKSCTECERRFKQLPPPHAHPEPTEENRQALEEAAKSCKECERRFKQLPPPHTHPEPTEENRKALKEAAKSCKECERRFKQLPPPHTHLEPTEKNRQALKEAAKS
ncbi:MAG: protein kinase, partial [Akkermansia sp.]|nr:protein kinase [Akkermansia sp.]